MFVPRLVPAGVGCARPRHTDEPAYQCARPPSRAGRLAMNRLACLVPVLLFIPALVFGQAQTTGRVTGKILDEEGNRLPVPG